LGFGRVKCADDPARRRLAIVVYFNDHPPAHVHVIGPARLVVVNLLGLEVRAAIGCTEVEVWRVLRFADAHQATLLEGCKRYHG
jgi:hypothetical protein